MEQKQRPMETLPLTRQTCELYDVRAECLPRSKFRARYVAHIPVEPEPPRSRPLPNTLQQTPSLDQDLSQAAYVHKIHVSHPVAVIPRLQLETTGAEAESEDGRRSPPSPQGLLSAQSSNLSTGRSGRDARTDDRIDLGCVYIPQRNLTGNRKVSVRFLSEPPNGSSQAQPDDDAATTEDDDASSSAETPTDPGSRTPDQPTDRMQPCTCACQSNADMKSLRATRQTTVRRAASVLPPESSKSAISRIASWSPLNASGSPTRPQTSTESAAGRWQPLVATLERRFGRLRQRARSVTLFGNSIRRRQPAPDLFHKPGVCRKDGTATTLPHSARAVSGRADSRQQSTTALHSAANTSIERVDGASDVARRPQPPPKPPRSHLHPTVDDERQGHSTSSSNQTSTLAYLLENFEQLRHSTEQLSPFLSLADVFYDSDPTLVLSEAAFIQAHVDSTKQGTLKDPCVTMMVAPESFSMGALRACRRVLGEFPMEVQLAGVRNKLLLLERCLPQSFESYSVATRRRHHPLRQPTRHEQHVCLVMAQLLRHLESVASPAAVEFALLCDVDADSDRPPLLLALPSRGDKRAAPHAERAVITLRQLLHADAAATRLRTMSVHSRALQSAADVLARAEAGCVRRARALLECDFWTRRGVDPFAADSPRSSSIEVERARAVNDIVRSIVSGCGRDRLDHLMYFKLHYLLSDEADRVSNARSVSPFSHSVTTL